MKDLSIMAMDRNMSYNQIHESQCQSNMSPSGRHWRLTAQAMVNKRAGASM